VLMGPLGLMNKHQNSWAFWGCTNWCNYIPSAPWGPWWLQVVDGM
jgi:hypothetical protein